MRAGGVETAPRLLRFGEIALGVLEQRQGVAASRTGAQHDQEVATELALARQLSADPPGCWVKPEGGLHQVLQARNHSVAAIEVDELVAEGPRQRLVVGRGESSFGHHEHRPGVVNGRRARIVLEGHAEGAVTVGSLAAPTLPVLPVMATPQASRVDGPLLRVESPFKG